MREDLCGAETRIREVQVKVADKSVRVIGIRRIEPWTMITGMHSGPLNPKNGLNGAPDVQDGLRSIWNPRAVFLPPSHQFLFALEHLFRFAAQFRNQFVA